jgi:dynein heavy chain
VEFLVDKATVGEWQLQGLPNDDLSIQNGIMVTNATRFPLMIDPQNQAYNWIKAREPDLEKRDFIFLITNPQLKERIRIPIEDGAACMIENVEEELDVLLDPLLEPVRPPD